MFLTYEDERVGTESEAHAEWHATTGLKYGCPQDACWAPDPDPIFRACDELAAHAPHMNGLDECPGVTPFTDQYAYPYPAGPYLSDLWELAPTHALAELPF